MVSPDLKNGAIFSVLFGDAAGVHGETTISWGTTPITMVNTGEKYVHLQLEPHFEATKIREGFQK